MPGERLLVPVSRSPTLRKTVAYAVESALSEPGDAHVRFVFVHSPELADGTDEQSNRMREADELLSRISVWAEEDAGENADRLTVGTDHVGTEVYLFGPSDVAEVLRDEVEEHDLDRIVIDPEYDPNTGTPFLRPFERDLVELGLEIEEAPVRRTIRRTPLLGRTTPRRIGALFGLSFVFYQILSGKFYPLDVVTGAVSAIVVTAALSRVTFSRDPTAESVFRVIRAVIYVPYLLYEIVVANIQVAAVILHPRMPIDPRMTRIRPAVWGSLPVTSLANSITLTPGTLTVRVEGRKLMVHTLLPASREGLFDGGLERAIRFVFYGRRSMRLDSLEERGETEVLQPPDGAEADDGGDRS